MNNKRFCRKNPKLFRLLKKSAYARTILKELLSLPLLPKEKFDAGYDAIKRKSQAYRIFVLLSPLFRYFNNFWMEEVGTYNKYKIFSQTFLIRIRLVLIEFQSFIKVFLFMPNKFILFRFVLCFLEQRESTIGFRAEYENKFIRRVGQFSKKIPKRAVYNNNSTGKFILNIVLLQHLYPTHPLT